MRMKILVIPIMALSAPAAYFGLQLGQPVTETQIITRYATLYVAEQGDGAQVSDCLATPNLRTDVRLVVRCTHPNGTIHSYFAGPRGEPRLPDDPQEPQA